MANGTIAASQIEMLSQAGTGVATIVPPATNTNRTLTLPDSTGTVATLGTTLTVGTSVSASSTLVDFTGIPAWAKRITVMLNGVSTNGTSNLLLQVGAGSITTSGYTSAMHTVNTTNTSTTAGFGLTALNTSTTAFFGHITVSNFSGNIWIESHVLGAPTGNYSSLGGGTVTLSGVLDQIRITTVNGTDTFDAGTINIMYEG